MCELLEFCRERLSYDPATGEFTWIKRPSQNVKAGARAGSSDSRGRRTLKLGENYYKAHQIAWLMTYGEMPPNGYELDHINGDPSDNRIANLRLATHRQNMCNRNLSKANLTSGVTGVHWHARDRKWQAQIRVDGEMRWLGQYDSKDQAIAMRQWAEREFFGEFRRQSQGA